jgi:hypothetical protein
MYIVAVSFIGERNQKKNTDLPKVTDKLYHIIDLLSTPHHEQDSNSQR